MLSTHFIELQSKRAVPRPYCRRWSLTRRPTPPQAPPLQPATCASNDSPICCRARPLRIRRPAATTKGVSPVAAEPRVVGEAKHLPVRRSAALACCAAVSAECYFLSLLRRRKILIACGETPFKTPRAASMPEPAGPSRRPSTALVASFPATTPPSSLDNNTIP